MTKQPINPDLVGRVARAICQARCVGNQRPDDMMGLENGTKPTPPYRWQCEIPAATAAIEASRVEGMVLVPREPTEEMLEAAAATPGMKAASDAMVLHQARGYGFDAGSFVDGSPLEQAYRAMIRKALTDGEESR